MTETKQKSNCMLRLWLLGSLWAAGMEFIPSGYEVMYAGMGTWLLILLWLAAVAGPIQRINTVMCLRFYNLC